MAELDKPLNPLELGDGEKVSFTVVRWELGETLIAPQHAPQGKRVQVLRLHVRPEDKAEFPPWWDITSTRLYAQLVPQLRILGLLTTRWVITAQGFPPKKYFRVERVTGG